MHIVHRSRKPAINVEPAGLGPKLRRDPSGARCFVFELVPGVQVHVEPRQVSTQAEFLREHARHWIALDGRVNAKPCVLGAGPFWNADHHVGVDRLLTPCAAKQVLQGLQGRRSTIKRFEVSGQLCLNVAVNDADLDVCLALALLQRHKTIQEQGLGKSMSRLVDLQDRIDRRGGCLPLDPNAAITRAMAWINEPYVNARMSGALYTMTAASMAQLIRQMLARIDQFERGEAQECDLDGRFVKLPFGGKGWEMVREIGYYSRAVMAREGIQAIISVDKVTGAAPWRYSLWRLDKRSDFNVPFIYEVLNAAEHRQKCPADCWGGSKEGGGSPRESGSFLSPQQVSTIVNTLLFHCRKFGFSETALRDYIQECLPQILESPPKAA